MSNIPQGYEECKLEEATHLITANGNIQKLDTERRTFPFIDKTPIGTVGVSFWHDLRIAPHNLSMFGVVLLRKIDPEQIAIEKLSAIEPGDQEKAGSEADNIIEAFLKHAHPEVAKALAEAEERAGGFWRA